MLTPEQATYAKERYELGLPIKVIAREIGTSYYMVRSSFDPEYKRLVADRRRACERRPKRVAQPDDRVIPISIPRKVLRERDEAYACPMTPSQVMLGDPPYCRSALARKAAHA